MERKKRGLPKGTSQSMRLDGTKEITEDTPLTPLEQKFIKEYMKFGIGVDAMKATGIKLPSNDAYGMRARLYLDRPNVKAEIRRLMDEIRKETVATTEEVMSYFTAVMRGEVKDQFGLDAPLSERTKAAQEIAKRTVDIENRKAGLGDNDIKVTINWDE